MNSAHHPKALFIGDKWCAGNFRLGTSEWETNLWKSLQETEVAEVDLFHFDEYYRENGKKGDGALLQKIEEQRPDVIILVTYKSPGHDENILEWETLKKIKELRIPVVTIWGDLEHNEHIRIAKTMLPFITLNVATASEAAVRRIGIPEKFLYMWVPKNPLIFNDPHKIRDIDVSYVGSPRNNRMTRVQYLIKNNIPVNYGGGESKDHFTTEEYANKFQRSKITLSFSRAAHCHVINARPFEAMLCGAMLLEQENFETPKLFTPFLDYVPYTSNKDLAEKIQYYLEHEEERRAIAKNGQEKTARLYSAERFWKVLINMAIQGASADTPQWSLASADLSRLSSYRAYWLRFLNAICSNRLGFFLYQLPYFWMGIFQKKIKTPFILYLKKTLSLNTYNGIVKYYKMITRQK